MKNQINYWAILVFFIIAILCRYLTNVSGILDLMEDSYFKVILTGIGPTIGVSVVFLTFKIRPIMSLKGNYTSLKFPILIYWAVPIALISLVAYFRNGVIPWLSVLIVLIYGLVEEIGWRGFLYQQLKVFPLLANIMIVSSLWFIWHLNFDLSISNLVFYGILILGSWGIGKVADLTNSLIAVSAFHSLNNFFTSMDSVKIIILLIMITVWISGLILRKRIQKTSATPQFGKNGNK